MAQKKDLADSPPDLGRPPRKPYNRPKLETYGALQRLTKGTGPDNGDAGQGMMPAMI